MIKRIHGWRKQKKFRAVGTQSIFMNHALLLIDFQNDYFDNGAMTVVGSDNACKNARMILDKFRKDQLPIRSQWFFSGVQLFLCNGETTTHYLDDQGKL
jgi:hypothetical protein